MQILAGRRVEAGVLLDDFQGDIAMEDFVKCAVDDAHSAFANLFGNAVMTDDLTDQRTLLVRPMLMRAWEMRQRSDKCTSAKGMQCKEFQFGFHRIHFGFVSTNPGAPFCHDQ